jgi:isopentenyldiphosphate isomerase
MSVPEYLPLVDKDGIATGQALRSVCHNGKSLLLHPVVHLHIINPEGEIYLQKRPQSKDVQPGKWDTSVGGHVNTGETIEVALERETLEESGLYLENPEFIMKYVWESEIERELVYSYRMITSLQPVFDGVEVETGRFWKIEEIKETIGKNIFTPNFEHEFKLLFETEG